MSLFLVFVLVFLMINYSVTFLMPDGSSRSTFFSVKNWTGLSRAISLYIKNYLCDLQVLSVTALDLPLVF